MSDLPGHIDFATAGCLVDLPPITLGEMDSIKLMNRVDTKYCTREDVLLNILEAAGRHGYRVLEVDGARLTPYNSLYYDTDGLGMYRDHHNKRLVRQKIRTRVYVNSGTTFLEIKRKQNTGRTKKKRIQIDPADFWDIASAGRAGEYGDFIAEYSKYTLQGIHPAMETIFSRITLVNDARTERITMDTGLRFVNHDTGADKDLGRAVIIEIKQDGRSHSEMKDILLDLRVKPLRVSKYCIGTALTNPAAPKHRFKVKIRAIEKTTNQKIC